MCWDKEPSIGSCAGLSSLGTSRPEAPTISRELLRSVCEPFFDQMLDALQHVLEQQQQRQRYEEQMRMQAVPQCPPRLPLHHLDPMPDEESTDIDEFGAFASLLSGPSSEDERSGSALPKSGETSATTSQLTKEEPDQISDPEKSAMVCRHWKTKGWCRMESKCKFQHPEHKRGVALPNGGNSAGNARCGDMIGAERTGIRTTLNLTQALSNEAQVAAAVGRSQAQKKQSKVKTGKAHYDEMDGAGRESAASSIALTHETLCTSCTSAMGLGPILD